MKRSMLNQVIMREHIKFSFLQSIPVMLGYLFLGIAFGLMLQNGGYNFIWAFFASVLIYAGSMQFVLVSLLTGGAGLLYSAIMTLFINGRHIFYGLSFIDKFKGTGKFYPYLIFSLTDETYSVLCNCTIPKKLEENTVMFLIALFHHIYWISGSVLGALIGEMIPFDSTGIDFSMTALFVVIFVEQWKSTKSHIPAWVGLVSGIFFLLLLGPDGFLLPALGSSVLFFLIFQNKMKGVQK